MTLESTIRDGRRAAEKTMLTTVRIYWTEEIFDNSTGQTVTVVHEIYAGKARIRKAAPAAQHVLNAGQFLALQELTLWLPFEGTDQVTSLHKATVTANPLDPQLVGAEFTILGAEGQTAAIARRFIIERKTP